MAIVTFTVPDEVNQAFNKEFSEENQNTILTNLMIQAIEENRIKKTRNNVFDEILAMREKQPIISNAEICIARKELRKLNN